MTDKSPKGADVRPREELEAIDGGRRTAGARSSGLGKIIRYTETRVVPASAATLRDRRVLCGHHHEPAAKAYKILRTRVLQKLQAEGQNSLAVVSATPGEGKTLTALNLAISLARDARHTVMLVDLDLVRPSVHKYLGYEPVFSVCDCLLRGVPLSEALFSPGIDGLVVLPARARLSDSSELLSSPAMADLVHDIRHRYANRLIVFDLPPVLCSDDVIAFLPLVDAVLMVIREGQASRDDLARAMDLLQATRVIGTVLNGTSDAESGYY